MAPPGADEPRGGGGSILGGTPSLGEVPGRGEMPVLGELPGKGDGPVDRDSARSRAVCWLAVSTILPTMCWAVAWNHWEEKVCQSSPGRELAAYAIVGLSLPLWRSVRLLGIGSRLGEE